MDGVINPRVYVFIKNSSLLEWIVVSHYLYFILSKEFYFQFLSNYVLREDKILIKLMI